MTSNQPELFPKVPPSEDEVMLMAAKIGIPIEEAYRFLYYYQSNGWKVGKNPMKNWVSALLGWKLRSRQIQDGDHTPPSVRLKAIDELLARHPANSESICHKPNCGAEIKAEFQTLKTHRERLLRQLAGI